MPSYLFLIDNEASDPLEFPHVDAAKSDAEQALRDFTIEAIRGQRADIPTQITICDESRKSLVSVALADVMPEVLFRCLKDRHQPSRSAC